MQTTWGPEFVTDPTAEAEVPVDDVAEAEEDVGIAPPPSPRTDDRAAAARALRELEAAKARVERDAKRAQDEMREKLVIELLPALDNIDRTIAAAQAQRNAPAVVEGVQLVRRQILSTLEGFGVRRVDARGQAFDPQLHEAISMVAVEPRHDRLVVEQLEPGYMMGHRLLRPAKVVVGRANRYH